MKKPSSPNWVNIGTSYATAFIVILGGVFGLVPPNFNWIVGFIVLCGLMVILPSVAFFQYKMSARRAAWLYFFCSHILAFIALVYVAGVDNPFISLWVVMLVVSYLELGKIAFVMSATTLFGGMVVARITNFDTAEESRLASILISLTITLFLTVFSMLVARIAGRERRARRDLEQSRDLEREQYNKLNVLINSLRDVVITVDTQGYITAENAAARNFFDTNETTVHKKIEELLSLQTVTGEKLSLDTLLHSLEGIEREDIVRRLEDGEEMRLRVEMHPIAQIYGSGGSGSVVIIRDITKQKSLEEEKDEFISVASHELRTPIAIAEGSLSNAVVLHEKQTDPERLIASIKEAHKQVEYLSSIVNDLATLSHVDESEALKVEEVSIPQLVKDLQGKYAAEATAHSLVLDVAIDSNLPNIMTSRAHVEEILQNLVINAIKYTKEGSVTLSAHERGDGTIVCGVTDTGVGISRADQARIFEKFYRSEDFHTRETGGSGLGLYIAQKLANKIGARISVASKLGEGSTFSVELSGTKN